MNKDQEDIALAEKLGYRPHGELTFDLFASYERETRSDTVETITGMRGNQEY